MPLYRVVVRATLIRPYWVVHQPTLALAKHEAIRRAVRDFGMPRRAMDVVSCDEVIEEDATP